MCVGSCAGPPPWALPHGGSSATVREGTKDLVLEAPARLPVCSPALRTEVQRPPPIGRASSWRRAVEASSSRSSGTDLKNGEQDGEVGARQAPPGAGLARRSVTHRGGYVGTGLGTGGQSQGPVHPDMGEPDERHRYG